MTAARTPHGIADPFGAGRIRRGGWTAVDAVLALVILGIVAGGLAMAQSRIGHFNAVQWTRQRCLAAAQGQLDSLAATGRPLPEALTGRLWKGIHTRTQRLPGEGDWKGLTLVRVQAAANVQGREVRVTLARYLPAGKEPP